MWNVQPLALHAMGRFAHSKLKLRVCCRVLLPPTGVDPKTPVAETFAEMKVRQCSRQPTGNALHKPNSACVFSSPHVHACSPPAA